MWPLMASGPEPEQFLRFPGPGTALGTRLARGRAEQSRGYVTSEDQENQRRGHPPIQQPPLHQDGLNPGRSGRWKKAGRGGWEGPPCFLLASPLNLRTPAHHPLWSPERQPPAQGGWVKKLLSLPSIQVETALEFSLLCFRKMTSYTCS